MNLITIIAGLFKSIIDYFANKQLLDAGEAKNEARALKESKKLTDRARSARRDAVKRLREHRDNTPADPM